MSASRNGSRRFLLVRLPVGEFQQHIAVARQRRAPADQIAAAKLGKCGQQLRLTAQPAPIQRNGDRVRRCIALFAGLNGLPHLLPDRCARDTALPM